MVIQRKQILTILIGIFTGTLVGSLIGVGILFELLPFLSSAQVSLHEIWVNESTQILSSLQKEWTWVNETKNQESEVGFINELLCPEEMPELITIQNNSLVSLSNPFTPETKTVQKINAVITAYSSTSWETDDNPFITAAGTWVRDGIVANNYLSMGTKIRIPQIFGDKIFVVEDRMHWTKSNYHIDIWFPDYWEAKNFGVKITYIEVLEN